jgi:hypothetical protein
MLPLYSYGRSAQRKRLNLRFYTPNFYHGYLQDFRLHRIADEAYNVAQCVTDSWRYAVGCRRVMKEKKYSSSNSSRHAALAIRIQESLHLHDLVVADSILGGQQIAHHLTRHDLEVQVFLNAVEQRKPLSKRDWNGGQDHLRYQLLR